MKKRFVALLISGLCLGGGILIYSISRPDTIYINRWIADLISDRSRGILHSIYQNVHLPGWIIYSLPDALWMSALTLMILMVWNFRLNGKSIVWIGLAIISGFLFECLQVFHLIRGTFDPVDLVFMFLGAFLPISISLLNVKSWKTS